MKVPRWATIATVALLAAVVAAVAGLVGTSKSRAASEATPVLAALISDIGRFNDRSFNQSQLEGAKRAQAQLGVKILPLESRSVSDYIPNLTTAVRRKANLVIAAGFLLAPATATVAKKFPTTNFAITDYPNFVPPFGNAKFKPLFKNVLGLTYSAHEGGCLVGVLAALQAKRMGGNTIGVVGGVKIPPVDIWLAGYRFCAQRAVKGTKVLIGYSQDFVAADKCKTVAENQIAQGAKVLFQVAGGCGLGTLAAADEAKIWGIGVDKDQYNDAKRVLTSAVKRVDVGVFKAIEQVVKGKFAAGNLNFDLKNGGMGVGRINPSVTKAMIATMNSFKARIISGKLKVPTSL